MTWRGWHPDDGGEPVPPQLELHHNTFTVGCRYCGAQPGQPCLNKAHDNQPLAHFAAHLVREKDAAQAEEELPF